MEQRVRTAAAPTAGRLILASLARLRWPALLGTLRTAGLVLLVTGGSLALLLAATLVASQIDETHRIEGLARQVVQGARTDAERFERVDAFVYGTVQRTRAERDRDPDAWIQPPPGPLGALVARYPASGRYLKPFFEPAYASFLKPGALQAYFQYPDCAGAARLMIRMLAALGIEASKLALYDDAGVGRHAVVEAEIGGRLVVADANHGYVYRLPDGRLATAEDLARDPAIARARLAPGDNPVIADFRNARSINWDKVPVLMPLAYAVLHRIIGERVDRLPRPAFLEMPKLLSGAAFLGLGALLFLPLASIPAARPRRGRRRRAASRPAPLRAERSGAVGRV